MNKKVYGILIAILAIIDLLYTPIQSRFAMHLGEIDMRFGILDICISFTNKLHIIGFGIISVLLLQYFSDKKKYWKTFICAEAFGLLIEITQIFFTEGHFRLRDLVSDAVGIIIALVLYSIVPENKKTPKFIMCILLLQIVIAMIIYYVFKELSISIGGEILRKYL